MVRDNPSSSLQYGIIIFLSWPYVFVKRKSSTIQHNKSAILPSRKPNRGLCESDGSRGEEKVGGEKVDKGEVDKGRGFVIRRLPPVPYSPTPWHLC